MTEVYIFCHSSVFFVIYSCACERCFSTLNSFFQPKLPFKYINLLKCYNVTQLDECFILYSAAYSEVFEVFDVQIISAAFQSFADFSLLINLSMAPLELITDC
jgi:hypothetical protein